MKRSPWANRLQIHSKSGLGSRRTHWASDKELLTARRGNRTHMFQWLQPCRNPTKPFVFAAAPPMEGKWKGEKMFSASWPALKSRRKHRKRAGLPRIPARVPCLQALCATCAGTSNDRRTIPHAARPRPTPLVRTFHARGHCIAVAAVSLPSNKDCIRCIRWQSSQAHPDRGGLAISSATFAPTKTHSDHIRPDRQPQKQRRSAPESVLCMMLGSKQRCVVRTFLVDLSC